MASDRRRRRVAVTAAALALAIAGLAAPARVGAAKTDIRVDYDKKFSFKGLRTWAWHPDGAGDVRLAVSADADPARVASRVEPVILPAVERELSARGLTRAAAGADLYLHYYVLASVSQSAQTRGQFLPAVPEWGVPLFAPVTTSLSIYPVGTLIIDVTSPSTKAIVWRGDAERKLDFEHPDDQRRTALERAIHDLLRKFPPKQ